MVAVLVMQTAVDDVVDVIAVRYGFVAAVCAVDVVMMFVGFAGHFFSPNVQ